METVTKKQIKDFVKGKLSTDRAWALRGVIRILEFQTKDEIKSNNTYDYNGVGFTGFDGEILTSIAKFYLNTGKVSNKQLEILFRKMPKYWKQLVNLSDKDRLLNMIVSNN